MLESWKKIIDTNILKLIYEKDEEEKKNNLKIFPNYENIFKAFTYFELNQLKVVIIGQDPYHQINQATGLAFGTNNFKIPPSLKNIANELFNDVNIKLKDYTLESWAKQGILLLNCALTVQEGKPGSHMKIWSKFTDNIIENINKLDNIIFVAWGAFAHKKLQNIDLNKHYLIVSSHPSPLSNFKQYGIYPSFNNSKPFSKINNYLKKLDTDEICW